METTSPKDLRKGKLLTAARYNHPADDDVYGYRYKVAETYKLPERTPRSRHAGGPEYCQSVPG